MQSIRRFANQPLAQWTNSLDTMIDRERFSMNEVHQCCQVLSNCQQTLLQGDLHAVNRKYRHKDIADLIQTTTAFR